MAGTQPQSISIRDLASAVDRAVKAAVRSHPNFAGGELTTGPVIRPGWPVIMGIIYRPPLPDRTLAETNAFATEVTTQLARDSAVAVKPLESVVLVGGGHTTIGFVPPIPIQFTE